VAHFAYNLKKEKVSRWPSDTKDCSLLLLEVVKVEPHGCQLGWTSNKSHKERKWLQRGQALGGRFSKEQRITSPYSRQPESVLGPSHDPDGQRGQEISVSAPHGGTPEAESFENPDSRETTNYQQMAWVTDVWVRMRHPHTQAEALPCCAELDRHSSRPRWLWRSPGGTTAIHAPLWELAQPVCPQRPPHDQPNQNVPVRWRLTFHLGLFVQENRKAMVLRTPWVPLSPLCWRCLRKWEGNSHLISIPFSFWSRSLIYKGVSDLPLKQVRRTSLEKCLPMPGERALCLWKQREDSEWTGLAGLLQFIITRAYFLSSYIS
jgi:hypothetical protein